MGSFTSNMDNHITLQTKGTSIDLTIKESYIQVSSKEVKSSYNVVILANRNRIRKEKK